MVAVIVKNLIKENDLEEFVKISQTHASLSYELDEGCLMFEVTKPKGEEVVYIELWENEETLQKHALRAGQGQEVPVINKLRYDKKMEIYNLL